MKKFVFVLLTVLAVAGCDMSQKSGGGSLKFNVSGDREEKITFTHVYAMESTIQGLPTISVRFSNPDDTNGFPALQLNIRNVVTAVGTTVGGAAGQTADIQLNFSSWEYYTTYDTYNLSVTVDEYDKDGAVSGRISIGSGGLLTTMSGDAAINLDPAEFDFYCSFVYDLDDDEYPEPEPID